VTALSPSSGPAAGGTAVTIAGTGFARITSVRFGTASSAFTVVSPTQIAATAPAGTGTVDVVVATAFGESERGPAARFTYVPAEQVVTFDDLTTGGLGETRTAVTTQYASRGITFSNATATDFTKGTTALNGFARSGSVAAQPCLGEPCTTPLRATFATPQSVVRVWVGYSSSIDNSVTIRLTAKGTGGAVVGSAMVTFTETARPTPIAAPLEVRAPSASITEFEVGVASGSSTAVAVDDVTFSP
jgi:hypothetical protein